MSRHTYACHVRWSDVDAFGHVNNVKYFEYYQEARIAFLREVAGVDEARWRTGSEQFVVARLVVDYHRPVLFRPEPYPIHTWVRRVGRSSYDLCSQIGDGDGVLSRATAVMVAYDRRAERARPLSERERELLGAALQA